MNVMNLSNWSAWGSSALNGYLDRMQEVLNPPPVAPALPTGVHDVYEAPPTRIAKAARVAELQAQKKAKAGEHLSNQRAFYSAEFMFYTSCFAFAVGAALFSSPFTIPLAFMVTGAAMLGALTFYPRRQEYKETLQKSALEVASLQGQLIEAQR